MSLHYFDIVNWFLRVLGDFVDFHDFGQLKAIESTMRLKSHLGIARRLPDVWFLARHRQGLLRQNLLEGAPDLAIEVVSLESASRDWVQKFREYEAAGIREFWIVEPQTNRLEVYLLDASGKYQLVPRRDDQQHSTVIPGFWIRPEWLWQVPLADTFAVRAELGVSRRPH